MAMTHTPIPPAELELFKFLPDIKVVFDVGARADDDYVRIKPEIELHAFEPNVGFFKELKEKIGERPNTFLNNYGLGYMEGFFLYNGSFQAFSGGEAYSGAAGTLLPVKTLDWYIKEKEIKKIDFLKIDVEGFDFHVLLGGKEALNITKYLQYEHWNNTKQFEVLLGRDFEIHYVGYRNVLCVSKKLVSGEDRKKIREFIKKNNFKDLA